MWISLGPQEVDVTTVAQRGASHGPHSGDACDGDFGATPSGMGGK